MNKLKKDYIKTHLQSKLCFIMNSKDSFPRALREVAPEMELFLEKDGQNMKSFMIKLINIQSCTFRHFTKKLYLAGHG